MDDLKKDVVSIGWESITLENALELGKLAELYNIEGLLQESAEFIVKNDIMITEENFPPKLTIRCLTILKEALKESKQREKHAQNGHKNLEMKLGFKTLLKLKIKPVFIKCPHCGSKTCIEDRSDRLPFSWSAGSKY